MTTNLQPSSQELPGVEGKQIHGPMDDIGINGAAQVPKIGTISCGNSTVGPNDHGDHGDHLYGNFPRASKSAKKNTRK